MNDENFFSYLENLKNKKLYKIQEIEAKKREYKGIMEFIKEPRHINVFKNVFLMIFLVILLIVIILSASVILTPQLIVDFFIKHHFSEELLISILGMLVLIFSVIIIYLSLDKIRKNNTLYKMKKFSDDTLFLVEKFEIEEKTRYEALLDFYMELEKSRRKSKK